MADLARFHQAQGGGTHDAAVAELRAGHKTSHWMWFVFPQLKALGRSDTARHYGMTDLPEARAYLRDPVLSARLQTAAEAMLTNHGTHPEAVLGHTDALKLRSCATLFAAAGGGPVFQQLLDAFYDGIPDPLTTAALSGN